jgi:hypothetical protein
MKQYSLELKILLCQIWNIDLLSLERFCYKGVTFYLESTTLSLLRIYLAHLLVASASPATASVMVLFIETVFLFSREIKLRSQRSHVLWLLQLRLLWHYRSRTEQS